MLSKVYVEYTKVVLYVISTQRLCGSSLYIYRDIYLPLTILYICVLLNPKTLLKGFVYCYINAWVKLSWFSWKLSQFETRCPILNSYTGVQLCEGSVNFFHNEPLYLADDFQNFGRSESTHFNKTCLEQLFTSAMAHNDNATDDRSSYLSF